MGRTWKLTAPRGSSLHERFWSKVSPEPMSGCWLWIGYVTKKGYGYVFVDGVKRRAHRVSWEMEIGPLEADEHVLHRCDNRQCVRPAHCFKGDQAANNKDAAQKGRHRGQLMTHCALGHPLSGSNLRVRWRGKRRCRTCSNAGERRRRMAKRLV